jgi:hypothetical protein
MLAGYVQAIAFPLIGYFDETTYHPIHLALAGLSVGGGASYAALLTLALTKHKAKFSPEAQNQIKNVQIISFLFLLDVIVVFISESNWGSSFILTPLTEWISLYLSINFFALVTYADKFYEIVACQSGKD